MRRLRWVSVVLVAATICGMAATGWALDGRSSSIRTPIPPDADVAAPEPNMSLAAPSEPTAIGVNLRIINPSATCQRSEIGIGTSRSGQNIVVGANGDFVVSSQNFGATWSAQVAWPAGGGSTQGDPSVGFGRTNTNAYLAYIWNNPAPSCDFGVSVSTNSGLTFAAPVSAVSCPPSGPGSGGPAARGCFPDQETIAVDQLNAGPTGGDQIYLSWRQFTNIGCLSSNASGNEDASIACSANSSAAGSWGPVVLVDAAGDRPRPAVAPDGTVYVVYVLGDGGAVNIRRFSSCANGLNALGASVQVAPSSTVTAIPFLDRQGQEGNAVVGVDPFDSDLVYVVYGLNSSGASTGDPDVLLRISNDGGAHWGSAIRINDNLANNTSRYFPWLAVSPVDRSVLIAWYDRRDDPATNDLTAYYGARVTGGHTGTVTVSENFKISTVGYYASMPGPTCFSPIYGDYNMVAAGPEFMYATWASPVSPGQVSPIVPPGPQTTPVGVWFAAIPAGDVPQIQPGVAADFGNVCVGSNLTKNPDVNICNTGKLDLIVNSITGSDPEFAVVGVTFPLVISPDACFPVSVTFTPTSSGGKSATLTIASNDPVNPSVTVTATGTGTTPRIATLIPNSGSFGDVCVGAFSDLELTINDTGACPLSVSSITSSDSTQFQVAGTVSFPLSVAPGSSTDVPIRFHPTSFGAKSASITVASNDPISPSRLIDVSGNAPSGKISVTGSTDFGDVCAGSVTEKTIKVNNIGTQCTLNVTSVAFEPACSDFTLVNNPFPALVSHDSGLDVVIRFTPTSAGPKSCTLVIRSDDPTNPVVTRTVTANTPAASIDVPPDQSFLPEVTQSTGVCTTAKPFPISNTGKCNLNITNVAIGGTNSGDYSLSGLPSFPIILQPGHVAGEGNLKDVFAPTAIDRDRLGTLTVTYESDPVTHASTSVTRNLCGEGVLTGARVLVRAGGVPVSTAEKIQLQRINANRNKSQLDTNDVAQNVALQSFTPAAGTSCTPFQFHREYGTVSNPIQLLPGSYQVTATAIVNGKRQSKTVGFDVTTCDFNPTVYVDF
jgi:HYDIN/CFA65/VesB family protein/ASPM-SPD-2-Hydin domain-containing protein